MSRKERRDDPPSACRLTAAGALAIAAAGAGAGAGLYCLDRRPATTTTVVTPSRPSIAPSPPRRRRASRSTTSTSAPTRASSTSRSRARRRLAVRRRRLAEQQAEGSGFVYDTRGHIVTNQHVVDGATRSPSRSGTARRTRRTLVGSDNSTDLAVIKVDAPVVDPAPAHARRLGATSQVGDTVIAIGSPFGLAGTVTSGIVSALHRAMDVAEQLHDRRLDPDRRADQPRQLGRPADRRRRPA